MSRWPNARMFLYQKVQNNATAWIIQGFHYWWKLFCILKVIIISKHYYTMKLVRRNFDSTLYKLNVSNNSVYRLLAIMLMPEMVSLYCSIFTPPFPGEMCLKQSPFTRIVNKQIRWYYCWWLMIVMMMVMMIFPISLTSTEYVPGFMVHVSAENWFE